LRVQAVRKVYPSVGYHLDTNKSPAVIRADTFWATTGGRGQGVKIAVVDDGVDQANPFFNPGRLLVPRWLPEGRPRVDDAEGDRRARLPRAGLGAAGTDGALPAGLVPRDARRRDRGRRRPHTAPAGGESNFGPGHPQTAGLSGIAPRAWIGNYRVFDVPVPTGGLDAFTPEIVLAFEAGVNDGNGRDQLLRAAVPEIDPSSDALIDALDNAAAAGVVPVISAGNDREDFGLGSVGSPSNAPARSPSPRPRTSTSSAAKLQVTGAAAPASLQHIPFSYNLALPPAWVAGQTLVDVGTGGGYQRPAGRAARLRPTGFDPNDPRFTSLVAGSLTGMVALVSRGGCTFDSKVERVRRAGASRDPARRQPARRPELHPRPARPSGRDDLRPRRREPARVRRRPRRPDDLPRHRGRPAERDRDRAERCDHELLLGGPTNFEHKLKPDVAAAPARTSSPRA
jgi:subtilisin family serine protease